MVETRSQSLRRANRLATYLCPNPQHVVPAVPPECPFGHRRRSVCRGRAGAATTEPTNNLLPLPTDICIQHISKSFCVKSSAIRCEDGYHPSLHDLDDLDSFLARVSCSTQQPLHSVTVALAQLQLDSPPPGGPINRLPNELLVRILSRLTLHQLVLSSAIVCKRWREVVCSLGHNKSSLYLGVLPDHYGSIYRDFVKEIMKRLFGQMNMSTITHFTYRSGFGSHLAAIFPNVHTFVIDLPYRWFYSLLPQLPVAQLTTLSLSHRIAELTSPEIDEFEALLRLINQFESLKRLDLQVQPCEGPGLSLEPLAQTLARLEHFACGIGCVPNLVSNLGHKCTRVSLCAKVCYEYFSVEESLPRWHTINALWLANVTHLSFHSIKNMNSVIEYLATHALSLQCLCLAGSLDYARMTSRMIGLLSRLKRLTELDLSFIIFDLPELDSTRCTFQLAQLVSLRACTLEIEKVVRFEEKKKTQPRPDSSQKLASVLCTIMPTVQQLTVSVWAYDGDDDAIASFEIVSGVETYLDRFNRLTKHSFKRLPQDK